MLEGVSGSRGRVARGMTAPDVRAGSAIHASGGLSSPRPAKPKAIALSTACKPLNFLPEYRRVSDGLEDGAPSSAPPARLHTGQLQCMFES